LDLDRADWIVSQRPVLELVPRHGKVPHTDEVVERSLDFDQLFRQYAPYVGAIALRILGRLDESDDVVQEVFLIAHRCMAQLRDIVAVKAWLAKITVRCARRRLRRAWWLRVIHRSHTPDFDELVTTDASPEERAHVASAYRLLANMASDERIVWVLRHLEEEPLERIAELVGCSLSTVQRRLRRAHATMETLNHD
jgi:RNA polymerase sigma-70 factor (ECF subfamily)